MIGAGKDPRPRPYKPDAWNEGWERVWGNKGKPGGNEEQDSKKTNTAASGNPNPPICMNCGLPATHHDRLDGRYCDACAARLRRLYGGKSPHGLRKDTKKADSP